MLAKHKASPARFNWLYVNHDLSVAKDHEMSPSCPKMVCLSIIIRFVLKIRSLGSTCAVGTFSELQFFGFEVRMQIRRIGRGKGKTEIVHIGSCIWEHFEKLVIEILVCIMDWIISVVWMILFDCLRYGDGNGWREQNHQMFKQKVAVFR